MTFDEQRKRYFNDPLFHAYVDILYSMLMEGRLTVSELRDAATFAGIKFEFENVAPHFNVPVTLWDEGGLHGLRGFGKDRHCGDEKREGPNEGGGPGRVANSKRPLIPDSPHQHENGGEADEARRPNEGETL